MRTDAELAEIEMLARPSAWRLDFGGSLEKAYVSDHRVRAVASFRHSSVFIFLLYMLLSSGIYMFMPEQDLSRWLSLYGWVGIIIMMAGIFSQIRLLDAWFPLYAGAGSFAAVALSVAVTGIVVDPAAGQLTQVAIMYAIVIIYSVVGLSFRQAVCAGWLGGMAGFLLIWAMDGKVNWDLLHRTYTGSSMLGMFIAYYAERRDRDLYVQTQLLQSAREKTEAYADRLDCLSRQDALTGLANRRHLDEALQQEWRRAARSEMPIAVLMIDIDHFKHYNDAFGHVGGDDCLRSAADIIAAHARRPGDLAVRYGGEEFLLLYPGADKELASAHAMRLLTAFRDARIPQAPGLPRDILSVSIGVAAVVPEKAMMEPEELICAADDALYEAKHAGRDGWRYAAGIDVMQGEGMLFDQQEKAWGTTES